MAVITGSGTLNATAVADILTAGAGGDTLSGRCRLRPNSQSGSPLPGRDAADKHPLWG